MALGDLTTIANVKAWLGVDGTTTDAILQRMVSQISATIMGELQRPSLISQTYTDLSDGFDSPAEYLDNWPVTAVSQVAVNGQIIPAAPLQIGSNVTNNYGYRLQPWDGYSPGGPQAVELMGARFNRGRLNVSITYIAGYLATEVWIVAASITVNALLGLWAQDVGVTYANGTALTKVAGSPAQGQYAATAGVYSFNAADIGQSVTVAYSYVPSALEDACINWVAERFRYRDRIGQRTKSLGGQETMSWDMSAIPGYVVVALQPFKKTLPI